MWKSGICLRAATNFSPQGVCEYFTAFHSLCGKKFSSKVFNNFVFHIPQDLLITFRVKESVCTFLVPPRKVPKESS